MKSNGSIRRAIAELVERTARAEEQAAIATEVASRSENRAARAEDQVARLQTHQDARVSRAAFLGKAGAVAAGAAGALWVSGRPAAAADGGNLILGASGDTSNTNLAEHPTEVRLDGSVSPTPRIILLGNDSGYNPAAADWPAAVGGWGNTRAGVYGFSNSGDGVVGSTFGTGSNAGVRGLGSLASPGPAPPVGTGILGVGGSTNGAGVIGAGAGNSGGIQFSTGWPFAGVGVYGRGSDSLSGQGVIGIGGGSTGVGVTALAAGWPSPAPGATGVTAYGGGVGVYATGTDAVHAFGNPAGIGILAQGGTAVSGDGGASGRGVYLNGGRAPLSLNPAATSGPPTSPDHLKGDIVIDNRGTVWSCIVTGNPGTFVPLQQGGLGNALFTAVSTQQYKLINSDGVSWVDMDATNLKLTLVPSFNCQGIFSANADLWTSVAGFNQDIAIFISGGAYGSGQVVAWKESGGFAGTFSPNAAFVETVQPLVAGTTYTVKVQWKANKSGTSTIWAAAGPIPAGSSTFSPTRLTGLLVLTS